MENKLKVTDILPLSEAFMEKIGKSTKKLKKLEREYEETQDLVNLERIKKEFLSQLQYFATLYSKTKAFKGSNHTYLEHEFKQLKAETLEVIMEDGTKVTAADKLVYYHKYYQERKELMMKIIQFLIKVELLYDHFSQTLKCIVQSISVEGKEFANQKYS